LGEEFNSALPYSECILRRGQDSNLRWYYQTEYQTRTPLGHFGYLSLSRCVNHAGHF
jgi:hypothetical protein